MSVTATEISYNPHDYQWQLVVSSRNSGKNYDISEVTDGEITWSTERGGHAGKVQFTAVKNAGEMIFHEGDNVRLFCNEKPLFSVFVDTKSKQQEKITTTCYDQMFRLKSKQSYNFSNMTAGGIVQLIAAEFGLQTGTIVDTGYILPTKIYEEATLLDIIMDSVQQSIIATEKVYNFYDDAGKLSLKEASEMKSRYVIGNGSLATDYTYETSISDSYNYIKLVRPNRATNQGDVIVAYDPEAEKAWGRIQYYAKVDEALNDAQIKEQAKQLLNYYCQTKRTLKVKALGVPDIQAGAMVMMDIPDLGDIRLTKMLLIDKCTHHISSNSWTMDLEMRVVNG